MNNEHAHTIAVAGLAGVFAYQGLVPKVWKVDASEVALWQQLGVPASPARRLVRAVGAVEASFAIVTALRSQKRWPFVVAIAAMPALSAGSARADRTSLTRSFNPCSLGIAVASLGAIALATRRSQGQATGQTSVSSGSPSTRVAWWGFCGAPRLMAKMASSPA